VAWQQAASFLMVLWQLVCPDDLWKKRRHQLSNNALDEPRCLKKQAQLRFAFLPKKA
jgi:hypothetical protein